MQSLLAGQEWNRYRVDAYLGGGGMADVYLVTHVELGVQRALKVLKQSGDEVTPRLVREGQLQATLMHPNLVPVLELIRVHGHPALVMDYVDGPGLDEFMAMGLPTLEQVDVIARGVLDGMVAAHRRGVVHRDLKPANVMLDLRDEPPVARVTDFGLAKAVFGDHGPSSTASGVVMGTPRYMAPEQISDAKSVDERADVWSMGALLYELVTGQVAFPGDSIVTTLRAVDRAEFVPVTDVRPDVPARMALAIEEALVRDVDERCPTMVALRKLWVGRQKAAGTATFQLADLRRVPTEIPEDDGSGSLAPVERADRSGASSESAATAEPGRRRVSVIGIAAAGVSLVAVGLVALLGWQVLDGSDAEPVGDVAAERVGVDEGGVAPTPATEAGTSVDEAGTSVDEADGTPAEATASDLPATAEPAPSPPVPATRAAPTPAPTASPVPTAAPTEPAPIRFGHWDAKQAGATPVEMRLRARSGLMHDPGRVPAGSYDLMVRWKGEPDWERYEGVTVRADDHMVLSCNGLTYKCGRQ